MHDDRRIVLDVPGSGASPKQAPLVQRMFRRAAIVLILSALNLLGAFEVAAHTNKETWAQSNRESEQIRGDEHRNSPLSGRINDDTQSRPVPERVGNDAAKAERVLSVGGVSFGKRLGSENIHLKAPLDAGKSVVAEGFIAECAAYSKVNRLTIGRTSNVAECYAAVLKRNSGHHQVLEGFIRSAQRYPDWAKGSIVRGTVEPATRALGRFVRVNTKEHRGAPKRKIAQAQGFTPEMVRIKGNCFRKKGGKQRDGGERPHRVCVKDFSLAKYEVTRGEYAMFVRATSRATHDSCLTYEWRVIGRWKLRKGRNWRSPGYEQTDTHPVVCVSHGDAIAYATWLSQRTGRNYRLPTEAEWVYAARGKMKGQAFWRRASRKACKYANVADRAAKKQYPRWEVKTYPCNDKYAHTAPVGSYQANKYKLYDMLGNVWEWTCSAHGKKYRKSEIRCAGSDRYMIRGGSWSDGDKRIRFSSRSWGIATTRGAGVGFRLAEG